MDFLGTEFAFDGKERRIRCATHILNLVVKTLMYGTKRDNMEELVDDSEDDRLLQTAIDAVEDREDDLQAQVEPITLDTLASYRKSGPMGKLHNIGVQLNYSTQLVGIFEEAQVFSNLD